MVASSADGVGFGPTVEAVNGEVPAVDPGRFLRIEVRFVRASSGESPVLYDLTIGATNRLEALDPALLRPGRFDKKLRIDAPDLQGRRDIFAYYLSRVSHDDSMDPMILASETPGYTPADIKYLLNEALRYALFAGRRATTYRDFQLAKPEHELGVRTPIKNLSRETKERLAFHEAGHAVAVRLFMPGNRISRITIIRQGMTFGHVLDYPARESYPRAG